jgi:hypothetical protein
MWSPLLLFEWNLDDGSWFREKAAAAMAMKKMKTKKPLW